jgi:ATP-dependent helicase/DNAse subunit B
MIISPLEESIKANGGSFDEGIRHLAKSIESNEEMITMIQNLEELHNDKESDNCDEIYDTETELFNKFIELTGLHIESLHCDDIDDFRDELICML